MTAPGPIPSTSLRVLHLVGYLHGNDGITTHLMALAEGLQRRGDRVGVASCVETTPAYHIKNRGPDWFDSHGAPHFYVPFPDAQRPDRRPLDGGRGLRAFYEAVSTFKPDVIHLHSFSLFPYAWGIRLVTGIPIVSTIHLNPDPKRTGVRLMAAVNSVVSLLPDGMVALCREQEALYRESLRAPDARIFRIPHGIDAAHFRPPQPSERHAARTAFGLGPSTPTVALVGRLDHVKGHDVLIRALGRLHREGRSIHALFAGTGAGEADIRRLIEAEGLSDTVHMLGFADSRTVLWAADVSVLPSRREAFPLVTLEAMLCGVVPIRTPASGAYDQILDGDTGFIIPFDDDAALADRLRDLFDDPARRAEMAAASLQRARSQFAVETMIDRTRSMYAAVTGRAEAVPSAAETIPSNLGPLPSPELVSGR